MQLARFEYWNLLKGIPPEDLVFLDESGIKPIDGLTFEALIAQRLVPTLWQGAVVIMDNCSIHKNNQELEVLITAAGARIIYLPPYSPDFSPIENCWSKVKTILRRIGARTIPV